MWRWAIGSGAYGLTVSPTDPLRAKSLIGSKVSRSRVLSHAELRALWQAIEQEQPPWQGVYKTLLLTGARLTEVTDMTRDEIDWKQRLWTVPASRYKTGETPTSCRCQTTCTRCSTPSPDLTVAATSIVLIMADTQYVA